MSRRRPLLRIPDLGMRPLALGPSESSSAPALLVLLGLALLAVACVASLVATVWVGALLRQLLGA